MQPSAERNQFVHDALEQCASAQDNTKYHALLSQLSESQDEEVLAQLLTCVGQWASIVGQHHERFKELLVLLFAFDWSVENERIMTAFEDALVSLVSSNIGFIEEAFRLLVKNFVVEDDDDDEEEEDDDAERKRTVKLNHLHSTIHRILRVCPLGCSTLLNIVIECFPRQQQAMKMQTQFAREALRVGDQVPVLQDRLIRIAIKSLLELDLELTSVLDENKNLFATEVQAEESSRKRARKIEDLQVAEKVDSMLCVLFDYCDDVMGGGQQAKKKHHSQALLFKSILDSFEKEVLRTGRAKFSQFFIFYVCASKHSYVDSFVQLLMERLQDEKENALVRENAAKFLGSFLARAKFVSVKTMKSALAKVNEWLALQVTTLGGFKTSQAKKKRSLFNATFQSVVYVLIFKGSCLGGTTYLKEELVGWEELCYKSAYRPMERISRDILEEYKSSLQREDLPLTVAVVGGPSEKNEEEEEVEISKTPQPPQATIVIEFPFDPLVLERSSRKIEPLYQEWYAEEEDEDEQDSEESEDEEEEEEDEADMVFLDKGLLLEGSKATALPKPIRIERIRRMLGGAWDQDAHLRGGGLLFPSPQLKPATSSVPGGLMLLAGGGPVPSTSAIPNKDRAPARNRSLSELSTESPLTANW